MVAPFFGLVIVGALIISPTAALTRLSSTKATYQVSFRETYGRHVLTATAYDNAGNAKSRSIHVRNVR